MGFFQASTFSQVLDSDSEGSEEKSITALGLLNTMETILTVMEEHKEVRNALFGIINKYNHNNNFEMLIIRHIILE